MQTEFKLDGHGWAELRLSSGPEQITIVASYLSDSPRELLAALVNLLRGSEQEDVVFLDEPGETLLRMKRLPGDLVHIKVFGGVGDSVNPSEPGEPMFRHKEQVLTFGRQVHREFAQLKAVLGTDGYDEQWIEYRWPALEFEALSKLVAL